LKKYNERTAFEKIKRSSYYGWRFADYQCPFVGQFFTQTYRSLVDTYVKNGKLRIIIRDLPLSFTNQTQNQQPLPHDVLDSKTKYGKCMINFLRLKLNELSLSGMQLQLSLKSLPENLG
jgi:hypothetical protein